MAIARYRQLLTRPSVLALALTTICMAAVFLASPRTHAVTVVAPGVPNFDTQLPFDTSTNAPINSIASGILDDDTTPDLVMGDENGEVIVYLSEGSAAPQLYESELFLGARTSFPSRVAVGDVDGSGEDDIVVANTGRQHVVYLNAKSTLVLSQTGAINCTNPPNDVLCFGDASSSTIEAFQVTDIYGDNADEVLAAYSEKIVIYSPDAPEDTIEIVSDNIQGINGMLVSNQQSDEHKIVYAFNQTAIFKCSYDSGAHKYSCASIGLERISNIVDVALINDSTCDRFLISATFTKNNGDSQRDVRLITPDDSCDYAQSSTTSLSDGQARLVYAPSLDAYHENAIPDLLTVGDSQVRVFQLTQDSAPIRTNEWAIPDVQALLPVDLDGDQSLDIVVAGTGRPSIRWGREVGEVLGSKLPALGTEAAETPDSFATIASYADLDGNVGADLIAVAPDSGPIAAYRRGIQQWESAGSVLNQNQGAITSLDVTGHAAIAMALQGGQSVLFVPDGSAGANLGTYLETIACPQKNGAENRCFAGEDDSISQVAVGQIDDDGRNDVVVGRASGPAAIYLQQQDGSYDTGAECPAPSPPVEPLSVICIGHELTDITSIKVAPFNFGATTTITGVVVARSAGQSALYLMQTGALTITSFALATPLGGSQDNIDDIAIGDVNADNFTDIVAIRTNGQSQVYLGNSSRQLTSTLNLGGLNDQINRAVVSGNTILVGYANRASAVFSYSTATAPPSLVQVVAHFGAADAETVAVVPFDAGDSDGQLDAVVVSRKLPPIAYRNVATAVDFPRSFGRGSNSNADIAAGDIDNDGDIDIVVASWSGKHRIYKNNGQGDFSNADTFGDSGDFVDSLALADVNRDSWLDIITGNVFQPSKIFLNNGAGGFASGPCDDQMILCFGDANIAVTSIQVLAEQGASRIVAAIFDQLTAQSAIQSFSYSAGSVAAGARINLCAAFCGTMPGVALADIDRQAGADLIAGRDDGTILLFPAQGGGFSPAITLTTNPELANIRSIAAADLNRDGWQDLVVESFYVRCTYLSAAAGPIPPGGIPSPAGQRFFAEPACESSVRATETSLADMNDDGWIDLSRFTRVRVGVDGSETGGGEIVLTGQGVTQSFGSSLAFPQKLIAADVDGHTGIDLIMLSRSGESRIFLNSGHGRLLPATGNSQSSSSVLQVALGDITSDNQLDLLARTEQGISMYANSTAEPTRTHRLWMPGFGEPQLVVGDSSIKSFALGALAGPTLDLVVANSSGLDLYRRNAAGAFTSIPAATLTIDDLTAIALGDLDGDGRLDAVLARAVGGSLILRGQANFSQPFTTTAGVERPANDTAIDCANPIPAAFSCFGPASRALRSVALADLNADGALDIITTRAGTSGDAQPNETAQTEVYFNDGTGQFSYDTQGGCTSDGRYGCVGVASTANRSIATADIDGDAAVDIVVGIQGGQSIVYLNDGNGGFATSAVICGNELDNVRCVGAGSSPTTAVAAGDIDGDGLADVLLAQKNAQSQAYLNNGFARFRDVGTPTRIFGGEQATINALALGDVNGDGALDVAAGGPDALFLNGAHGFELLPNNPPQVMVRQPGEAQAADFYARPQISASRVINIPFSLYDPEGDSVRAISATYSLDGGANWQPALPITPAITLANATPQDVPLLDSGLIDTTNINTRCGAQPYTRCNYLLRWDVAASRFYGQSDNVVVRIVAYPGAKSGPGSLARPPQHPAVGAQSWPFRAQGIVVKIVAPQYAAPPLAPGAKRVYLPILSKNMPADRDGPNAYAMPLSLAGAKIYCIGEAEGCRGQALGKTTTRPFVTNRAGVLLGRGQAPLDGLLMALLPAGGDLGSKRDLYYTSAATPVNLQNGMVQTLVVQNTNPLLLFNLSVSLEWDARNDRTFMSDLEADLQRASALIYDWTNGQAALGEIKLYHNREQWNQADVRVYASNRLRPNATKGGIANKLGQDEAGDTAQEPLFKGGRVQISPVWNRWGNTADNRNRDWPNALAHELGHYLFSLDDNYLGYQNGVLVAVDGCPGAMTDPYREDGAYGEFVNAGVWNSYADCRRTLSAQRDWRTITTNYPWLNGNTPNPGPKSLLIDVTHMQPQVPTIGTPLPLAGEPSLDLLQGGERYTPRARARAFLFRTEQVNNTSVDRMVDLGRPEGDQVRARGLRQGDRVCVYDPEPANSIDSAKPPELVLGCTVGNDLSTITLQERGNWFPDVRVTTINSTTLNIQVRSAPGNPQLVIQFYPTNPTEGIATRNFSDTVAASSGIYSATFTVAPNDADALLAGYVRVQKQADQHYELVVDYALGGGPVSAGSSRGGDAPGVSADGQVIVYVQGQQSPEQLFTIQPATQRVELPPWATQIGQTYRLTYLKPPAGLAGRVAISFNYLGREVPKNEDPGVTIYFRPDDAAAWQELDTSLDTSHNIASARAKGPGLYALGSSVDIERQTDKDGWMTFPYSVRDTRPITQALAYIDGQYLYVATIGANAKFYDVSDPANSTLKQLRYADGSYVILMRQRNARVKLRLRGPLGAPAGEERKAASAALSYFGTLASNQALQPRPGMAVEAWVSSARCGTGQVFAAAGGLGYWVTFEADRRPEQCGAVGSIVSFRVAGQPLRTTARVEPAGMLALRLEP